MVAQGLTNSAIAGKLELSPWTVSTHLRRIFAKLDVTTRAAMVAVIAAADNPAGDATVPYRTARPEPTPAARQPDRRSHANIGLWSSRSWTRPSNADCRGRERPATAGAGPSAPWSPARSSGRRTANRSAAAAETVRNRSFLQPLHTRPPPGPLACPEPLSEINVHNQPCHRVLRRSAAWDICSAMPASPPPTNNPSSRPTPWSAGCYRVFTETSGAAAADRLSRAVPTSCALATPGHVAAGPPRPLPRHLVDTITSLADRGVGFRPAGGDRHHHPGPFQQGRLGDPWPIPRHQAPSPGPGRAATAPAAVAGTEGHQQLRPGGQPGRPARPPGPGTAG